jgi:cytochrome c oxidase assembly factor CtaG
VQSPFELTVLVPVLAVGYLALRRRVRGTRAHTAAFALAAALIAVAFATRLQPLALHTFLWAHLLQNVVLAEWAPGLLALAVPATVAKRLRVPAVPALVVWLANYFTWHVPWLYDLALHHPHSLLHVEHLSYLLTGVLMWWPIVHGSLSAGAKAAYLFAAFVLASPLGLLLALLPRAVYTVYRDAAPTWGIGATADQQLGGVTMAAEQAVVFFTVFAVLFLRFLREEQSVTWSTPSTATEARGSAPSPR